MFSFTFAFSCQFGSKGYVGERVDHATGGKKEKKKNS